MPLLLLLGGARSGKSKLAVQLALNQPEPVTFIATAEPHDSDMADRIAHHRAERPATWHTLEEPVNLRAAIDTVPPSNCLVIDCLTLWVSNLLLGGLDPGAVRRLADEAAAAARNRGGWTVAISNEVGLGVVPANELGRDYRDLLGTANSTWAAAADRSLLVVAGKTLPLHKAPRSLEDLR